MSDPISVTPFSVQERRSFTLPALLAIAFITIAVALIIYFYPATTPLLDLLETKILPTHTVFKSDSIVVGPAQSSDVLFLVPTLRIRNTTRTSITVDDISCTFTDPTGAILTVKAATKSELANEQISFPALKPLSSNPLLRDISIPPGASAQGAIIFSLPFTQEQWNSRKSATLQLDIYHGQSLTTSIP